MNVARKLGSIELEPVGLERAPLAALWDDAPVVLVFLRHFG